VDEKKTEYAGGGGVMCAVSIRRGGERQKKEEVSNQGTLESKLGGEKARRE